MKNEIYVVRSGENWGVRSAGASRLAKTFETKAEAYDHGRGMAQKNHAELRVQNQNGQFGTCNSYGHDACPPHDKNR